MNTLTRNTLTLALAAALSAPLAPFAADKPADEHAGHHPDQAQAVQTPVDTAQERHIKKQAMMKTMQERMQAMQKTGDPDKRMAMMQEQMRDMQTVMGDMQAACPMPGAPATHRGLGIVKKLDASTGSVTFAHEPVKSLNWTAMTMTFAVRDKTLLDKLSLGKKVEFEFVQDGKGYVVTGVK